MHHYIVLVIKYLRQRFAPGHTRVLTVARSAVADFSRAEREFTSHESRVRRPITRIMLEQIPDGFSRFFGHGSDNRRTLERKSAQAGRESRAAIVLAAGSRICIPSSSLALVRIRTSGGQTVRKRFAAFMGSLIHLYNHRGSEARARVHTFGIRSRGLYELPTRSRYYR